MKDKVVLITGASRGIGQEIAYRFAEATAIPVITYCTDAEGGEATRVRCRELGAPDALRLHLDLLHDGDIEQAVQTVTERYGHIDVLVNNAAVVTWKPLEDQSLSDVEFQMRTNLEGLIKMTRACLPHVRDSIINLCSGAGKTAYADLTVYCATKFGVRGFTQALAKEVPRLKVYAVNPDMTATRMTQFQGRSPEEVAKVVFNTAKGLYRVPSGGDVDVWMMLDQPNVST